MADLFEEMLVEYSPDVREISIFLRDLIKAHTPGAVEQFSSELKHLTFVAKASTDKQVITLAPKKGFVFLVFPGAKDLEDSAGLLGSPGKQVRFMTVKTLDEASNPALSQLIDSAWAGASAA